MKGGGLALFVLGSILAGAGVIWGWVGFYASQAPIMVMMLLSGLALMFVGSKMNRDKEPNKAVAWRQPEDAATGTAPPVTGTAPPASLPLPPAPPAPPTAPEPENPPALDEATRVVTRRSTATWLLAMPDGTSVPLTGSALVGRQPVNPPGQNHSLVSVPNPDASVSKTHALLEIVGAELRVSDLGSTNGTVVVDAVGNETECVPDHPVVVVAGGSIDFGTYPVQVTTGGSR